LPFLVLGRRRNRGSPDVSFFALVVVENPRFAVGIVILSVIVPENISISVFGGHIAISGQGRIKAQAN